MASVLVCVLMCLSIYPCVYSQYINKFSVEFDGEREELEAVAESMGFSVDHELEHTKVFLLSHKDLDVDHRSKRSTVKHVERLNSHPKMLSAQQEELLRREKRSVRDMVYDKQLELPIRDIKDNSIYHRVEEARLSARSEDTINVLKFNDEMFKDQWSLRNRKQSGGKEKMDLNVDPAWNQGFTGKGVVICVLDDGIYYNHTDLIDNYDEEASTDLNDLDDTNNDPMPDMTKPENNHGTRCGGEIVAIANNSVCGVGVAYEAKIGGVRILDGDVTDALEAEALSFKLQHIDIFTASWGPRDNGKIMDKPGRRAARALARGTKVGRGGLGTIYVWATGNGGEYEDDCGADGYVSSIETLSFGSATDTGMRPYFMEQCTSTMAVVPSGGEVVKGEESVAGIVKIKVVTTDINNECIENFQGTSSAAPYAAGCVALALQANPKLTWRDVQHIVALSSRIPSVREEHDWRINGAGFHVSHTFGFGVIDCSRMVELAQKWKTVPEQHKCIWRRRGLRMNIASKGTVVDEVMMDGCKGANKQIDNLEHVQVKVKLSHSYRGDVQIFLVSPSNTWSEILSPRLHDDSNKGIDFTFMTVHNWGENPYGKWYLRVIDNTSDSDRVNYGMLIGWELILYGTAGNKVGRMDPHSRATGIARFPTLVDVRKKMEEEEARTYLANIQPAGTPVIKKNLQKERTNGKLVDDLINALKNFPSGNSFKRIPEEQVESPNERTFEFLRKLDSYNLHEEKKSNSLKSSSNSKLDDNLLDALVDEVTKELKEEKEEQQRKIEEEKKQKAEERELDDLVNNLKKKLLSEEHVQMTQQRNWQNGVSQEKKEEELLQRVLQEVKKEVGHDKEKMKEIEEKISSREEASENRLLEKVKKMLDEEGRRGSKREDDAAARAEKDGTWKSIKREELSLRTLTDLLDYLKSRR